MGKSNQILFSLNYVNIEFYKLLVFLNIVNPFLFSNHQAAAAAAMVRGFRLILLRFVHLLSILNHQKCGVTFPGSPNFLSICFHFFLLLYSFFFYQFPVLMTSEFKYQFFL
ncbi:hypothetical protein MEM_06283 [Candida albicans L26]|uniref:Uncharacterized protein n=2 Tax=Candida albicans TaxID=5476 RepID=C4YMX5_CANAW|nr:conserved hypothetical protein [Candida albicans WO-1]KGQ80683.1 hypothetical protein MG1_06303 [Candida albicans GC75]KGQ80870.1 hypothetical protein MEU_06265 [Candida albicans P37005]KGR00630.1 hypothetical protein MG3_06301 [Candida albicans P78048]KGR05283.1 hypothetical protein MG9_06288 [Candida albicans P37037]KGT62859.1 hypothetical protein MEK_06266 [Candida albicans 12C]KGU00369.1 hypothetical protein MEM_06283 [Candida albicans L26]KGU00556.1 hypothetical protein MEQ_06244 [Ca